MLYNLTLNFPVRANRAVRANKASAGICSVEHWSGLVPEKKNQVKARRIEVLRFFSSLFRK